MNKNKSYNLVLATYNGNYKNSQRNTNDFKQNKLESVLENIDYSQYDQITVVISQEIEEKYIDIVYNTFLNKLKETDKFKIIKKPNDKYLSYSSFYLAYKKYPSFDYYIFFEDDYIPMPKFRDIVTDYLKDNKLDYVFAIINYKHEIEHACHALSFVKGEILQDVFNNFNNKMTDTALPHQMAFYLLFKKNDKYKGGDLSKINYSFPFYRTNEKDVIYYETTKQNIIFNNNSNSNKEPLVMPTQYYFIYKKKFPNGKEYNYYNYEYI